VLDVALNRAFAQMLGTARVRGFPFVVFTHIDEFCAVFANAPKRVVYGDFPHASFRAVNQLQKPRRMVH
jgi:hypothetical protein